MLMINPGCYYDIVFTKFEEETSAAHSDDLSTKIDFQFCHFDGADLHVREL